MCGQRSPDQTARMLPAARIIGYHSIYQWRAKARMRHLACAGWCESTHFAHGRGHFFHFTWNKYSWLSLSRTRLSRITAYLKVKILSLSKHENLTTSKKYCGKEEKLLLRNFSPFPQYFRYISNVKSPITYIFVKCGCSNHFWFYSSAKNMLKHWYSKPLTTAIVPKYVAFKMSLLLYRILNEQNNICNKGFLLFLFPHRTFGYLLESNKYPKGMFLEVLNIMLF